MGNKSFANDSAVEIGFNGAMNPEKSNFRENFKTVSVFIVWGGGGATVSSFRLT